MALERNKAPQHLSNAKVHNSTKCQMWKRNQKVSLSQMKASTFRHLYPKAIFYIKCCQLKAATAESFFCTHKNTSVNNLHVLPSHLTVLCCCNYNLTINLGESLINSDIPIVVAQKPLKISCHCRDVCVILTQWSAFIHSRNLVRNSRAAHKGRKG